MRKTILSDISLSICIANWIIVISFITLEIILGTSYNHISPTFNVYIYAYYKYSFIPAILSIVVMIMQVFNKKCAYRFYNLLSICVTLNIFYLIAYISVSAFASSVTV